MPEIRPFAPAHTAGLRRLWEQGDGDPVDWVTLTPGGRLEEGAPRTGRHRFGGERVPEGGSVLSYADLAVAVVRRDPDTDAAPYAGVGGADGGVTEVIGAQEPGAEVRVVRRA
ncbi:hypothetical protein ACWC09_49375 [Streptomyces sp. NPDC001617]